MSRIGQWRCDKCFTLIKKQEIILTNVECKCGVGAGLWRYFESPTKNKKLTVKKEPIEKLFRRCMRGRHFGEQETKDAFEFFKLGYEAPKKSDIKWNKLMEWLPTLRNQPTAPTIGQIEEKMRELNH